MLPPPAKNVTTRPANNFKPVSGSARLKGINTVKCLPGPGSKYKYDLLYSTTLTPVVLCGAKKTISLCAFLQHIFGNLSLHIGMFFI